MKLITTLIAVALITSNSLHAEAEKNPESAKPAHKEYKEACPAALASLSWETLGGGMAIFTVTPAPAAFGFPVTGAPAAFAFHVTGWSFRKVDLSFTATNADPAYSLLAKIFNGGVDVTKDTFEPQGPTGTWTTITLNYASGGSKEVTNIDLWNANHLDSIYDFVKGHMPKSR